MNRDITSVINFILDNDIIPQFRDSRFFMSGLFHLALGDKYPLYMRFKDELPYLTEDEINQYYELLSDTFMKRETDCNRKTVQYILKATRNYRDILDAAAGKGYLSTQLLNSWAVKKWGGSCRNVTALDIILPPEEVKHKGMHFVKGTVTNLPFPDDSFDAVVSTHTLEHIKNISNALLELRRVCRKKLIVVIPRQREYKYTFDLHIHFFPYKYDVEMLFSESLPANKRIAKRRIGLIGNDWMIEEFYE